MFHKTKGRLKDSIGSASTKSIITIVFTKLYLDSGFYAINRTRVTYIYINVDLMTI